MKCLELCSSPVPQVEPSCPLEEARQLLSLSRADALIVAQGEEFWGLLSRYTLDHALRFGLEGTAGDFAQPDTPCVEGETEACPEVLLHLLQNPLHKAVIRQKGKVVGLLSTEDLFREGLPPLRPKVFTPKLPPLLREMVEVVYDLSKKLGVRSYLVGGTIRDLLLNRPFYDVDLVVGQKVEEFVREFGRLFRARCVKRSPFQTFKFQYEDWEIDIAQARWEYYVSPGALPQTAPGPFEADLFRRDFTINAMALSLARPNFGRLIDPLGGQQDLEKKCLRVHHLLSFVDDPTRLFRAARYMSRFALQPSPGTQKAKDLALNLGVLENLSGARLRNEWLRLLEEERPAEALSYLAQMGVLEALAPGANQALGALSYVAQQDLPPETRLETLALILGSLQGNLQEKLLSSPKQARRFREAWEELRRSVSFLTQKRPLSEKVFFLEKFPEAVLLLLAAQEPPLRPLIEQAFREYFRLRPRLTGKKLQEKGLPPGPKLGEMLKRLRAARLDGLVETEEDEWALLKKEYPDVFLA